MSNNVIRFEKLRKGDFQLLHRWFQIPYILQWYARGEKFSFDEVVEKYSPRIENTNDIPNYIVYLDDRAVGYIQLYRLNFSLPEGVNNYSDPLFNNYKPTEIAGIDLFIADEGLLGTGFSDRMLAEFIHHHAKEKFKAIVVDPKDDNEHAIQFFKRNKFYEIAKNNGHVIMMYKITNI